MRAAHSRLTPDLIHEPLGQETREALAQDNLYPRIAALSRRVLRSEKV